MGGDKIKLAGIVLLGLAAFGIAAWYGYGAWTRYEAKRELRVANVTYSEASFIDQACAGNQVAVVLFLKSGMSVNTRGKDDLSALQCAARQRQDNMVGLLLERGADVNVRAKDGRTPLMEAAQFGVADSVRKLLDAGADVNIADNSGFTVLMAAAGSFAGSVQSKRETLDLLLLHGADVKAVNRLGENALSRLVQSNPRADLSEIGMIVTKLLKAGADPNAKTSDGSPIIVAASSVGNRGLVDALVSAGADVNARGQMGTALLTAVRFPEVVKILLDAKADPNVANNTGNTPLLAAATGRIIESMKLLLDAGALPNPPPPAREGALDIAARIGDPEEVNLLVRHTIDVNAKNSEGDTALHTLARYGRDNNPARTQVAKTLLQFGADRNARNRLGKTPAETAADAGAADLAYLLSGGKIKIKPSANPQPLIYIPPMRSGGDMSSPAAPRLPSR
jgi:ankyrin repeat protein